MKMKDKLLAFSYFGGKYQFLEDLYENFPVEYDHFIDVFMGSLSVSLNLQQEIPRTANDINKSVYNFFKVLRENPVQLMDLLNNTMVSRTEFEEAWPFDSNKHSDVENARRFYVRQRLAFQGDGVKEYAGFNATVGTFQQGCVKNVKKYFNSLSGLSRVADQCRQIQFENLDYKELILKYDRPGTFFYCDPPYLLSKRGNKKRYIEEFTDSDHLEMLELLLSIEGKFMISGYSSEMYNDKLKDCFFKKIKTQSHCLKKTNQEECIWMNYDPAAERNQIALEFPETK